MATVKRHHVRLASFPDSLLLRLLYQRIHKRWVLTHFDAVMNRLPDGTAAFDTNLVFIAIKDDRWLQVYDKATAADRLEAIRLKLVPDNWEETACA